MNKRHRLESVYSLLLISFIPPPPHTHPHFTHIHPHQLHRMPENLHRADTPVCLDNRDTILSLLAVNISHLALFTPIRIGIKFHPGYLSLPLSLFISIYLSICPIYFYLSTYLSLGFFFLTLPSPLYLSSRSISAFSCHTQFFHSLFHIIF